MRSYPPTEEVILYETGFDHDLLGRSKFSGLLSEFVEKIEDPLVISINGKWGTGKSHFLKRWVGAHAKQNGGSAITVYFDAFSHDYISDPLIGLTQAVTERLPATEKSVTQSMRRLAIGLAQPAAKIGLTMLGAGAMSALGDLGDAAIGKITAEGEQAMQKFWSQETGRKHALAHFRKTLGELAKDEEGNRRPIVVVVDELDRCRPDFALEVLETIKHIFTVDNVHFVLGINISALEAMVRVRYGDQIDAGSYLRKFISVQLELPQDLGDHEQTPAVFQYIREKSAMMGMPMHLAKELLDQIKIINRRNEISLRDANIILSNLMIAPKEPRGENILTGWKDVFVTLVIARVIAPEMYKKLYTLNFTRQDLVDFFDAVPARVQRPKDGWTSEFDHNTLVVFGLWLYLLGNGNLPNDLEFPPFERAFEAFRHGRGIQGIPETIHREWLSTYSIT